MEALSVNQYLLKDNLFELFKAQLKKDFSISGLDVDFIDALPIEFELLRLTLTQQLAPLFKTYSQLSNLLYRIDISEQQIKSYQLKNKDVTFEHIVAELIIKRILQKVILKKTFS